MPAECRPRSEREPVTPTIVFDFDGTVAVGSGPVLAYAREVARQVGEGFLARVEAALDAFDRGEDGGFRDGYDVVGRFAAEAGLSAEATQAAYAASRATLGSDRAPVDVAPGLAELLGALPDDVRVVLATNAPEAGVERVLEARGVRAAFDELHFDVGKPAGLTPIIEEALAAGPVLAVGDMVSNDLAPAAALGADTALVGATALTTTASVTMRAATLAELADPILAWAESAREEHDPVPSGTTSPGER